MALFVVLHVKRVPSYHARAETRLEMQQLISTSGIARGTQSAPLRSSIEPVNIVARAHGREGQESRWVHGGSDMVICS
jgi:hypothetical protein